MSFVATGPKRRPANLRLIGIVLWAVMLALVAGPARAEDAKPNGDRYSYFGVSFVGGMLTPRTDFGDSHKRGLIAGGRFGWTSKRGLGLDVTADYSPLLRRDVPELTSFETHFAVATLAPRFTLRWRAFRFWVAGGGGIAFERTRELFREESVDVTSAYAPAASGGGGIELHLLSSGGLVIAADYTKVFGELVYPDVYYKFYNLRGGLVFVFR